MEGGWGRKAMKKRARRQQHWQGQESQDCNERKDKVSSRGNEGKAVDKRQEKVETKTKK